MTHQTIIDDEIRKSINTPYPLTVAWPNHIINLGYAWLFISLTGRGGPGILEAVNPHMPGEKTAIFDSVHPNFHEHLPRYAHYGMDAPDGHHVQAVLALLAGKGMSLPVVVKPERGLQGLLVQRLEDEQALQHYLNHFARAAPGHGIHFQDVVHEPVEFTAFYVRYPQSPNGHVTHVVLRQAPCVVGDGQSTLETLIRQSGRPAEIRGNLLMQAAGQCAEIPKPGEVVTLGFVRNTTHGAMLKVVTEHLTPAFSQRIDEIARSTGYLQYGRMDLRCPSLHEAMTRNRFIILEINGTLSVNGAIYAENSNWLKALGCILNMMRRLRRVAIESARQGGPVISRWAYFRKLRGLINLTCHLEKIEASAGMHAPDNVAMTDSQARDITPAHASGGHDG